MLTIDTIKYNVSEEIINTINLLVKLQKKDILKNWLEECENEIIRRRSIEENTYYLHCEKAYLKIVI